MCKLNSEVEVSHIRSNLLPLLLSVKSGEQRAWFVSTEGITDRPSGLLGTRVFLLAYKFSTATFAIMSSVSDNQLYILNKWLEEENYSPDDWKLLS